MGAAYELVDIPEEYADQAHKMREEMVEAISETDDQLLEKYLSGEEVTNDELKAALRRATIANQIQPVICGSAFKNKGVQPLLDAVVDYLPSPLDIPPIEGLDPNTDEAVIRHSDDSRAVLGAGVQDHDRPVRRPARLLPRLLGARRVRLHGARLEAQQQRAHRPPAQDARQQARGDQRGLGGRHRRGGGPEERHHRRHDLRSQEPGGPRVDELPRAGDRGLDRAEDEVRPGEARHGARPS